MIKFSGRILFIGCGSITQCVLPILFKHLDISPKQITIMDFVDNRKRVTEALKMGVTYVQNRITQDNYKDVLKEYLKEGDILLDLAWNISTYDLIEWCHDHGIRYLNTAVELWESANSLKKHPTEQTLYPRQLRLNDMASKWKNKGPTAIVDHGANPGLVSHFTKEALVDIAHHFLKHKPNDARVKEIERALADHNFAELSHLLGVKTIHISERDTQITDKPKRVNEFVNTWSVAGIIEEGMAPAELGWGTHEVNLPKGAMTHKTGPRNQICLATKGAKTWVQSWVPSGPITGMVIRHGEAFSISHCLTVWKEGNAIYRPTVHYAYCPCDGAINSLHELEMRHFVPQEEFRILNDEILSGKDELGCLLMGHDFKSWWIGSILDIEESRRLVPHQSATTVQVAVSVVSALVYMINHPNEGFCVPDDLNYKEILKVAKPYLGEFISVPVDWTPLDYASELADFNEKVPSQEELWQFTTFLMTPKGR